MNNNEKLQQIGANAYACIREMVDALNADGENEDARRRIEEDALSAQVRSGWTNVGAELKAEEYCILLSTGGPATRIIGTLDDWRDPISAKLEAQDWFEPWTEYVGAEQDILLDYARCFYFGE